MGGRGKGLGQSSGELRNGGRGSEEGSLRPQEWRPQQRLGPGHLWELRPASHLSVISKPHFLYL